MKRIIHLDYSYEDPILLLRSECRSTRDYDRSQELIIAMYNQALNKELQRFKHFKVETKILSLTEMGNRTFLLSATPMRRYLAVVEITLLPKPRKNLKPRSSIALKTRPETTKMFVERIFRKRYVD